MAKAYKKRSLGRGLSSILNDDENNIQQKNIDLRYNTEVVDVLGLSGMD